MSDRKYKHSIETKKKLSEAKKGRKNPNYGKITPIAIRKKISASLKKIGHKPPSPRGRVISLLTRKKLSKINKGKKLSEKHKRKISKSCKGRVSWNKNKKVGALSEAQKKKLSIIAKKKHFGEWMKGKLTGAKSYMWKGGKPKCIDCGKQLVSYNAKRCKSCSGIAHSGNNNPLWKGGITPKNVKVRNSKKFEIWRKMIFERDNWICQKCKIRGGKLHAHHIQNFSDNIDLRFIDSNGITFCNKCHREFHNEYGYIRNNQEQLMDFLSCSLLKAPNGAEAQLENQASSIQR